jgi:hypothetical protein
MKLKGQIVGVAVKILPDPKNGNAATHKITTPS